MNYKLDYYIFLALLVASLFFWSRGIVKGRKSDNIAGFAIFMFMCALSLVVARSSVALNRIGSCIILFGMVTLIASPFARPDGPIPRNQRITLGLGAIFCGLLMEIII